MCRRACRSRTSASGPRMSVRRRWRSGSSRFRRPRRRRVGPPCRLRESSGSRSPRPPASRSSRSSSRSRRGRSSSRSARISRSVTTRSARASSGSAPAGAGASIPSRRCRPTRRGPRSRGRSNRWPRPGGARRWPASCCSRTGWTPLRAGSRPRSGTWAPAAFRSIPCRWGSPIPTMSRSATSSCRMSPSPATRFRSASSSNRKATRGARPT